MNEELKAYASELVADGALSGTIRTDELTALLSRLEQAEQALGAAERQIAARTGETAAERIWRNRAEQAEQQVARVRAVLESDAYEVSNEFGDYDAVAVDNILDALDGES